jgi:hypothetical protein
LDQNSIAGGGFQPLSALRFKSQQLETEGNNMIFAFNHYYAHKLEFTDISVADTSSSHEGALFL